MYKYYVYCIVKCRKLNLMYVHPIYLVPRSFIKTNHRRYSIINFANLMSAHCTIYYCNSLGSAIILVMEGTISIDMK